MRYERLTDIIDLAIRMQGSRSGMTLDGIRADFKVSRKTAERMRDAVEAAFGALETVPRDDKRKHWRLRSDALRRLVSISAKELAELSGAADALGRAGLDGRAETMREIACKLRAAMQQHTLDKIEADVEALVLAEGLAGHASWPRPRLDAGLLSLLREAVVTSRVVEFCYVAQSTGRRSRQSVQPYDLLHGNRAFLVGRTDWADELRLWRLSHQRERCLAHGRAVRARSGVRLEGLRQAFLWHVPGKARQGRPALPAPGGSGRRGLPVPPGPGGRGEQRWLGHGAVHGRRHRRDVLAPRHLGDSVIVEKPARLRKRLATMCQSLALHHDPANPVGRETLDSQ